MDKPLRWLLLAGLLALVSGCAVLRPDFEPPTVSVTSFRALPTASIAPRFEIGLHVVNPNNFPLELQGIAYTIELEGHRILTGVANQLPRIAAYGEGDLLLQAAPDLFNTISLFSELLSQPREFFRYELLTKLDVGGMLPKIVVRKSGQVALAAGRR
jgi:LEA14-like dessication related protein